MPSPDLRLDRVALRVLTLGKSLPLLSFRLSFPSRDRAMVERIPFLKYFDQTLHSWDYPPPPTAPGRREQPHPRPGKSRVGAPRSGRVPRPIPGPRPERGSSERAASQVARYCFTFPSVYFTLLGSKGSSEGRQGLRFLKPGRSPTSRGGRVYSLTRSREGRLSLAATRPSYLHPGTPGPCRQPSPPQRRPRPLTAA